MWTTISKREPTALLLLGDNVYIDDPEHRESQQYCYYRRQSQPEWQALVASTPVFSIYDDHDFGTNDCVPGPDIDKPDWKREVWKTFTENWNNPAYGGGEKQPGCWYDFYVGDVHFIMGYNRKCSFGLMAFDTTLDDPQVIYTIVNIDNEEIDTRTLKLSQLKEPISQRGVPRRGSRNLCRQD